MKNGSKKRLKRLSAWMLAASMLSTSVLVDAGVTFAAEANKEEEDVTAAALNKAALSALQGTQKQVDSEEEEAQNPEEVVRMIVQLEEEPAIDQTSTKEYTEEVKEVEDEIQEGQESVIKKVEKLTGSSVINQSSYLVNSFSIEGKRSLMEEIRNLKGVKDVYESSLVTTDMDSALAIGNVLEAWDQENGSGYEGEGVEIAIIDTGVNYEHKDMTLDAGVETKHDEAWWESQIELLGYGTYYSSKIPFGYSYFNLNNEILNDESTHGYHVAGIAAANGEAEDGLASIQGVAPKAQILGMQVFCANPDDSSAYTDDIVRAIEDSVKLDADIINMSLGSDSGFNTDEDFIEEAVEEAYEAGVLSAISAGNSGTSDSLSGDNTSYAEYINLTDDAMIGSPSATTDSLSVASYNNTNVYQETFRVFQNGVDLAGYASTSVEGKTTWADLTGTYEIVDCGLGTPEEVAAAQVKGKIALIKRGGITFTEKATNADQEGAVAVILYNSDAYPDSYITPSVTTNIPLVSISNNAGKEILGFMEAQADGFSFSSGTEYTENTASGQNKDEMSDFSSWGPTPTLDIKPEISAPGGMIYSLNSGEAGYQYMSGTSMASPYVAGAQALVKESINERALGLKGSQLVDFMKAAMMNTAAPVTEAAYNTPYSVRYQGAGLLDVSAAVATNVTATYNGEACIELRQVDKGTKSVEAVLTFTNYGSEEETYLLGEEKVYTNGVSTSNEDVLKEVSQAIVTYSADSVKVPANGTATVTATLHLTEDYPEDAYIESFLHFESTDGISLGMPLLGFYGNWGKESIIDAPVYDETTYYGVTGLTDGVDTYLGTDYAASEEESPVQSEYAAISPNGDDVLDGAYPYLALLRNANTLSMVVEDENGTVVKELGNALNVAKTTLADGGKGSFVSTASGKWGWDGTLYDSATGTKVTAPDGQYQLVLKANIGFSKEDAQTLTLPVKVDTKAPTVSTQVGKVGGDYYVYITAADETSGVAQKAYIAAGSKANKEGSTVLLSDLDHSKNEDGSVTYSYKITDQVTENAGKENYAYVMIMDNGGNTADTYSAFLPEEIETVVFDNLVEDMTVHTAGTYTFTGSLPLNTSLNITCNDKTYEAVVDGYNFSCLADLSEGENTVQVQASKGGTVTFEKTYKVTVVLEDTQAPEITAKMDNTDAKCITTEETTENNVKVKSFYVADNGASAIPITVSVSDQSSYNVEAASYFTGEVLLNTVQEEVTNKEIILKDNSGNGYDIYYIMAEDSSGNAVEYDYYIYHGTTNEAKAFFGLDFKVTGDNFSHFMQTNSAKVNSDGTMTLKGSVTYKTDVFQIAGKDVKVKEDLTFEHTISLEDGCNRVYIYAADLDKDKEVSTLYCNYAYRIYYSSTAPVIRIENDEDQDGIIHTTDSQIVLKGNVTDPYNYLDIFVNDALLYHTVDLCEGTADYDFTYSAALQTGDNYFTITSANIGGLVGCKVVDVVREESLCPITTEKDSYEVTETDKDFNLNAVIADGRDLDYASSDKSVVSVSSKGKVKIKGCGQAMITITAQAEGSLEAAAKNIIITVKPKQQKVSSIESKKKNTLTVKWKKNKEAAGYELTYAVHSDFSDGTTVTVEKATNKTLTDLKAGKKYYVKVRSYIMVNGEKVYGEYSKTASKKVK